MNRTPLAEVHEKLNARMVDFSGWYLPVQYTGIVAEHFAVRQHCGIFDTCHMGRVFVSGPSAAEYLSQTLTVNAAAMSDGACRYGFLLNDAGGIIDDLIVYRISLNEFMVVINSATREGDLAQLQSHSMTGVTIEDVSEALAKIDVQGPTSPEILARVLGLDLSALRYFQFQEALYQGQRVFVSRTGYTGETGFEVYLPAACIVELWHKLIANGATPAGLGARDTLRLEAGLPLYGHEMNTTTTPLEAGFMRYIDLAREFIGVAALRAKSGAEPTVKLTPFMIEGRQSGRHGNKILISGQEAGWVTSGSFAPSLGYCIGFAYIQPAMLADKKVFQLDLGRKQLDACVTTSPFYNKSKGSKTL